MVVRFWAWAHAYGMCISLVLFTKRGYKGWQKLTFRAKRFSGFHAWPIISNYH